MPLRTPGIFHQLSHSLSRVSSVNSARRDTVVIGQKGRFMQNFQIHLLSPPPLFTAPPPFKTDHFSICVNTDSPYQVGPRFFSYPKSRTPPPPTPFFRCGKNRPLQHLYHGQDCPQGVFCNNFVIPVFFSTPLFPASCPTVTDFGKPEFVATIVPCSKGLTPPHRQQAMFVLRNIVVMARIASKGRPPSRWQQDQEDELERLRGDLQGRDKAFARMQEPRGLLMGFCEVRVLFRKKIRRGFHRTKSVKRSLGRVNDVSIFLIFSMLPNFPGSIYQRQN